VTELGRVADLRSLPREVPGHRASVFVGMVLFVVIEAVVVMTLLTSYYYIRVMTRGSWPPAGIEPPELVGPAISLSILVASVVPVLLARAFHRRERRLAFWAAIGGGLSLLLAHGGIAVYELLSLPFDWKSHVYGSLIWTIGGYQIFHVIALSLLAIGVTVLGSLQRGLPRDAAVLVLLVYWMFVVVAALPSYFTVYVTPRLF
jgi:heme/copper-type cytochrome/quinol oxidase subunit 3